jgi:hypothetical protein
LGCPFTNYWIKKGIELEKAGYEQGKKESLLLRNAEKKALAKKILAEYNKTKWSPFKMTPFREYLEELSKDENKNQGDEMKPEDEAELKVWEMLLRDQPVSRLLTENGEAFVKTWIEELKKHNLRELSKDG